MLIVEDESIVGMEIKNRLSSLGYSIIDVVSSGKEALEIAREKIPNIILIDIKLGDDIDGIETSEKIKKQYDIPIVYITAYSDKETLKRAKITEPYGYILKPFEEKELYSTIEIALYKHSTEKKLKESEEKYRDLFENANDIIQAVKPDGTFSYVNNKWKEIFGYNDEEISKLSVSDIIHPGSKNHCLDIFKQTLSGKEFKNIQALFLTKNGETVILEGNINCRSKEGEPISTRGIFRDITEKHRVQEELKKINRELEVMVIDRTREIQKLLNQKNEFIHQLGHDLKNPLTPILGFLSIIMKKEKDSEIKELIEVVSKNVKYMKKIVDNVLELAYLNSSKTDLDIQNINLFEEVEKIIDNNKLNFKNKKITYKNNIKPNILVKAEKIKLDELFDNLISNAIKYTQTKGKIIFNAEKKEEDIVISIKDNGIGLTKEQNENIFNEFYKTDDSRHDSKSTGLGLSICKRIIEKHGGNIWVESAGLGKGSTFYFTLKSANKSKEDEDEPR